MRYALVCDGEVVNVILWDGEEEYTPAEGCEIVEVSDEISIGWTRVDGEWVAPEEPAMEIPEEDPDVVSAKHSAVAELVALGVSENTARTIVGLPLEE